MKETLVFLVLLTISNVVSAAHDEWTTDDTKRQAVYLALHTLDWGQTRYIAKNPTLFHELNPFLGKDPSVGQVDGYFAATALIHTGVAYALPADWRKKFQYITIGARAGITARNYYLGIKTDF